MKDSEKSPILSHPEYLAVVNEKLLLASKLKQLEEEIKSLRHNCELFRKVLFAPKSERLVASVPDSTQELLFKRELNERPQISSRPEIEVKLHRRARRKRHLDQDGNPSFFPAELPRKEELLEPENKGVCPCCSKEFQHCFNKITEYLCEDPAKYFVRRVIRPVYKCSCQISNQPAPSQPLPKCCLDFSFIGPMLGKKFDFHLPFYRQSRSLEGLGIEVDRDVMIRTANKLTPIFELIVDQMLGEIIASSLVQMDESPITVCLNKAGKRKYDRNAYYWPVLAGKQVVFIYKGDRRHRNVPDILGKDFSGILLSDGYQAYLEYSKANPNCSLALCWDHARRNFFEIQEEEPLLAREALSYISLLYQVEAKIKKRLAAGEITAEKIPEYRREDALPVLNKFKQWLEVVISSPEVLPKSNLIKACNYVLSHWKGLILYLDYGIVPISNITIEQQIRNLKLGAKNWLFAASEVGARTVAVMNSLVCTCRMNGINFSEYITDVLKRLDTNSAKDLTPLSWAQHRQNLKKTA